ncbi:hypothetical protein AB205_0137170, partial [Aquarana catesbeiana]
MVGDVSYAYILFLTGVPRSHLRKLGVIKIRESVRNMFTDNSVKSYSKHNILFITTKDHCDGNV